MVWQKCLRYYLLKAWVKLLCDSIMKLYSVFIVYKYWISNIFQAIDAKVSCNSNMLKLVRDKQKCSSGLLSEDDACFF